MRLQVMLRTMEAMADMDLEVAERLMNIAELMAETHPRTLMTQSVDDLVTGQFEITRRSAPETGTDEGEAARGLVVGNIYTAPLTKAPAVSNLYF